MKTGLGGAYGGFAAVADEYWQSFGPEFCELMLPSFNRILRRHQITPHRVLDIGCGTGSFAIRLARRGMSVTGLDGSATALKSARAKALRQHAAVRFIRADMRTFSFSKPFDLVTSVFNTVNHLLLERDLCRMFCSVSRALRGGGFFFFDLNNESCFRQVWGGTSFLKRSRFALVRNDSIDPKAHRASAQLLIFLRKGKAFELVEDSVEERWFSDQAVRRSARNASLRVVHKENFNPFPPRFGYSDEIKSLWLLQKI